MRLETKQVQLNSIQIALLPVIAQLIENRANEPNNNKKTNINAHTIHKKSGISYNAVKTNLLKLKELSKNVT